MQDPFQTFLGAEPTDAAPLPPSSMSPGADGNPSATAMPWSPQDAVQVQTQQPLAVQSEAAAPVMVEAPPSNTKKYLLIAGAVLVGYWLLKGKKH